MKVVHEKAKRIIAPTGFRWYDYHLNPYVGCQYGCAYCYMRFLANHPWGQQVKVLEISPERLRNAAAKIFSMNDKPRLVMGTGTDPYMPLEYVHANTRKCLEVLSEFKWAKFGIYTKSDGAIRDLDLLAKFENLNIHITITPLVEDFRVLVESTASLVAQRWEFIRRLREVSKAKIRVNVAPALPLVSEPVVDEIVAKLQEFKVEQFYVDPMQMYAPALPVLDANLAEYPKWPEIRGIATDKKKYSDWKETFRTLWVDRWQDNGYTIPI
jgi:DNA repair photolyase